MENYLKGKFRFISPQKEWPHSHAYLFGSKPISSLENLTNIIVRVARNCSQPMKLQHFEPI